MGLRFVAVAVAGYDLYLEKQASGVANDNGRDGTKAIENLAHFASANVIISF